MGIFVDLSKAFDMLDHDILLTKLDHYGIRGTALTLLSNYINNREQYVYMNGVSSCRCITNRGVPQGSILGPFLFLAYINDLPSITSEDCILYADDTNIFITAKNENILYHKATTALQKLSSWLNANKLLANSSKSNYIIFAPKNIHLTLSNQLEMNNTVLERVSNTKFLGVYLDTQLSWHTHVHETTLKIYRKIPILYRLRYIFPIKTMLTLYHSFVHSHITYAIVVYGLTYPTTLKPLKVAQNTAVRALLSIPKTDSASYAYRLLNVQPIAVCVNYRVLLLAYKLLHNAVQCPSIALTYQTPTYSLRSTLSKPLCIPHIRTNYGSHSFSYIASKLWNTLPCTIAASTSFHLYKQCVRDHLQNSQQ